MYKKPVVNNSHLRIPEGWHQICLRNLEYSNSFLCIIWRDGNRGNFLEQEICSCS